MANRDIEILDEDVVKAGEISDEDLEATRGGDEG
jgi:hypothetical protein